MSIENHYFVRHGDYHVYEDPYEGKYNLYPEGSTPEQRAIERGDRASKEALERLVGLGVEAGTLVLATPTERAFNTAEIIAEGLESEVVTSTRLLAGSEHPEGIRDLDNFIALALDEEGVTVAQLGPSLVVVTHEPLIKYVWTGGRMPGNYFTRHGQVETYRAGSSRSYWEYPTGHLDSKDDCELAVSLENEIRNLNAQQS